jgi:hypothetical protein
MSSNFGSVPKFLSSVDATKTFWLKALPSSPSGDDCCVIRPLVRGLWVSLHYVTDHFIHGLATKREDI